MLGKQTDTLRLLVQAASSWRTAAQAQGVEVFQVNARMQDGRAVTLFWQEGEDDWLVTTGT